MNNGMPNGLMRDRWFWLALIAGPIVTLVLYRALTAAAPVGIALAQWRTLLWLVLIFPVIEEWLFRGVIQARLMRWRFAGHAMLGFSVANGITSLLFAAAHLASHSLIWALLVFIPSMVYGWFRDRYRSTIPGIALHISHNLAFFCVFGLR